MGRTLVTFTQLVQQEIDSWSRYRRALRYVDQQVLDVLFAAARMRVLKVFDGAAKRGLKAERGKALHYETWERACTISVVLNSMAFKRV